MDILDQAQQIAAQAQRKAEELQLEKDLFVYQCAFERGDFETMIPILQKAETNQDLNQAITELEKEIIREEGYVLTEADRAKIRAIVEKFKDEL